MIRMFVFRVGWVRFIGLFHDCEFEKIL